MTSNLALSDNKPSLDILMHDLQQLSRRRGQSFSDWVGELLKVGASHFNASLGELCRVSDQEIHVVERFSADTAGSAGGSPLDVSDVMPLANSFSGVAAGMQIPILAPDTHAHEKLSGHPFIKHLPGAYWGVAIHFGGVVWGTLSFSSEALCESHANDENALLLMAGLLELKLENEEYREELFGARTSYQLLSERLKNIQHIDLLTDLPNRGALFDYLHREINQLIRRDGEGAIALVDIDFFHMFNEKHGHEEGDRILKGVADSLRQAVRNYDYVARYSGEQFLVWFPDTLQSEVVKVCERMAAHVSHCEVEGTPVTISVGYCAFRSDSEEKIPFSRALDKLINLANTALNEAKAKGRNCAVSASKRPVTITSLPI
ncbi:diguanylate cyclase [Enterovibrio norvegicus FF-454]|uniref:diguanylate cyclase n=1 Tax=Enterovibrio norvegicus FF-454 TaxID=1185651 RepID=A0A1E5C0B8_9GAMM|nr:GGDEF domain-containing protein [Enterovibrio norvegicus]OEE58955.1 diguanylate cyclase [Enterovibrio norvegicus FF-454]